MRIIVLEKMQSVQRSREGLHVMYFVQHVCFHQDANVFRRLHTEDITNIFGQLALGSLTAAWKIIS